MIAEKKCSKCHEVKALVEFSKSKTSSQGAHGYCKKCFAAYDREYKKLRRDYFNKISVAWYSRRGGHSGHQERLEADSSRKAAFRDHIANGGSLPAGIGLLCLPPLRLAAATCIARSECGAALDDLLHELYGDDPDPGERPRSYNTMKRMIYSLKREFGNTGFKLVNIGYAKGYRFIRSAG